MKTGIVFDIQDGKAVIMKNGGEFIRVQAQENWRIGEIVPIREKRKIRKIGYAVAACFALFLLSGSIGSAFYFHQTSLISVDINPSVELGLNPFERVISVHSFNPEAQKIVEQVSIKNQSYVEALTNLLSNEEFASYLQNTDEVTFTVQTKDTMKETLLQKKSESTIQEILQSHHTDANVECYTVDEQTVEDAHEHGVTAGKYLYLQQLQEVAPEIDIEDYTHHSITAIKEQISCCQATHGTKEDILIENSQMEGHNHHNHRHHGD